MMRAIPLDRYRNIGILASQDAGRTTTTERMLAAAGRAAPGWVEQDNERAITLTSAATSCVWRDCRINIVDLPAADRLTRDGALSVLDAAVLLIDGVRGVTDEIAAALAAIEARSLPRLVFVNKLDQPGADLAAILRALAARAAGQPVLLQRPIGGALAGLVDLVEETAVLWPAAPYDAPAAEVAVPAAVAGDVAAERAALVIAAASGAGVADTGVPDAGALAADALKVRLREAVRAGRLVPVLVGSAFRNRGIGALLDAIVDYLPAPSELTLHAVAADGSAVERRPADEEPFAGLAFQTLDDPASGTLTFVRIYSGVVARGAVMLNSVSMSPERIGPMVRIQANHAEPIEEAGAGDIVALAGLKNTTTGDTLCDPTAPVILERVPASAGRAKH